MKRYLPLLGALCLAAAGAAQAAVPDTPAARLARETAPPLFAYTETVLFGDLWQRPELSRRDRSLVTMSSLLANGQSAQMTSHINLGLENGVKPHEIMGLIAQLTAAKPNAAAAFEIAHAVFVQRGIDQKLWHADGHAPELAPRDRSLVSAAALIASGELGQLQPALKRAMDLGLSRAEAAEVVTQLAFYAGWPRAMSALPAMQAVFSQRQ